MTTDDNDELTTVDNEPTTVNPTEEQTSEPTIAEDKITELINNMNDKFDAVLKQHENEVKELKEQLAKKDQEIKRIENVNKAIIMSTNVEQSNKEIDFNNVDFDEVNWNKEANTHMKEIDAKIF